MATIQPAGLLRRFVGAIGISREITACAAVDVDSHGRVSVTPRFFMDGELVPPHLLSGDSAQNILGHRVRLSPAAKTLWERVGPGKVQWAKSRAGPNLEGLRDAGVELQDPDGSRYTVGAAHYEGEVHLDERDRIRARADLVSQDGIVLPPPKDAHELRSDDGWYTTSSGIYRAPTTSPRLDETLLEATRTVQLSGDAAPEFLSELRKAKGSIGTFAYDAAVEKTEIFDRSNFTSKHMHVDGDAERVNLKAGVEYHGSRASHVEPLEAAQKSQASGRAYRRVDDGWVRVNDGVVDDAVQYAQAYRKATRTPNVATGEEIPEVISRLQHDSPWHVYVTEPVKDAHRIVDARARARFEFSVRHGPRRSLLELSPIYDHERFSLTHKEVAAAQGAGNQWVRRGKNWIRVDAAKFGQVEKAVEREKLEKTDGGFRFPAARRHEVLEVFSRLGTIEHTASYNEFLAKLADFTRIEDAPLPSSLAPTFRLRSYQKHGYNWLVFLRRYDLNFSGPLTEIHPAAPY